MHNFVLKKPISRNILENCDLQAEGGGGRTSQWPWGGFVLEKIWGFQGGGSSEGVHQGQPHGHGRVPEVLGPALARLGFQWAFWHWSLMYFHCLKNIYTLISILCFADSVGVTTSSHQKQGNCKGWRQRNWFFTGLFYHKGEQAQAPWLDHVKCWNHESWISRLMPLLIVG